MRMRLSKLARGDLDSIYSHTIRKWGREQADHYLNDIWDTFEKITQTPERWRLRNELHPGCRICFTGRHAVLYRIREGRVEIARVLHDAMDFPRHIPKDFMGGT